MVLMISKQWVCTGNAKNMMIFFLLKLEIQEFISNYKQYKTKKEGSHFSL